MALTFRRLHPLFVAEASPTGLLPIWRDYYDQGMQVPDDVTLLFADDNWGNIRRLPKPGETPRAGGYGVYYHFDYVGATRDYKWINTVQLSKTTSQMQLAYARRVVVTPGYGLAVAQAQHTVRELADELEKRGVEVSYAIHPVAGRMPGHMNVLLAEADVPYEQLKEMDDVNPELPQTDVALVIGANDTVNPEAGMPIIEVDKAGQVIVLKRSMNTGFAGIDNPLFYNENTALLFGDAKQSVAAVLAEVKEL
jgi:NAD/NADP transhydrogenase beta subunit